jgi:hypothetical protein
MSYNFQDLLTMLTEEYFTREQINYLAMKLSDPKCNSIYLQSVMHSDIKAIKSIIESRK